jgi:hypothetical protein
MRVVLQLWCLLYAPEEVVDEDGPSERFSWWWEEVFQVQGVLFFWGLLQSLTWLVLPETAFR